MYANSEDQDQTLTDQDLYEQGHEKTSDQVRHKQDVQPQKMTKGLKLRIYEVVGFY